MRLSGWLCPPRRGLSAALPALLCAVLLVACGSDDSKESAAVRKDITEALTTTDKDKLCKPDAYATQKFVDQQTFGIPEVAKLFRKDCHKDTKPYAADSVKVSKVNVDGEHATARMAADGGIIGYGDLDVALVKDASWKLDELTAVDIDRAEFNKRQITGYSSKAETACALRRLGRFSDAELEQALVQADVKLEVDPLLVCVLRPGLREGGLSLTQTSCVLKALRSQGDKLLRLTLKEDQSGTDELFERAGADC